MRTLLLLAVALVGMAGCAVHVSDPYGGRAYYRHRHYDYSRWDRDRWRDRWYDRYGHRH